MNDETKAFQEALDRIDRLARELSKLRRAVEAFQEGMPFDETFDEEIFTEGKQDRSTIKFFLPNAYYNLLKLRFRDTHCKFKNWYSDRTFRYWYDTVKEARDKLREILEWNTLDKSGYGILMDFARENISKFYESAIYQYEKDAKKLPEVQKSLELLPKECPWTLEEFLDEYISDMIQKIPLSDDEDEDRIAVTIGKAHERGFYD